MLLHYQLLISKRRKVEPTASVAKVGRHDLHVSSHDDQADVVLLEQVKQLGFAFRFRLLGDRDVVERDAIIASKRLKVQMIGYD